MAAEFYCPTCGSVGKPKVHNRGSSFIEIILWFCFLLPGLLYSLWRMGRVDRFCRKCHAANPLPIDSPVAQRSLNGQSASALTSTTARDYALTRSKQTTREISWQLTAGIFLAPFIFGWALVKPGYSNAARMAAAVWGLLITVPLLIGIFGADSQPTPAAATPQSPQQSSKPPSSAPQSQQADNTNPLAGVKQWNAILDGNKVACYADTNSGHRWYIVVPTPEQRENGETTVVNDNPSDGAWAEACTKETLRGSW